MDEHDVHLVTVLGLIAILRLDYADQSFERGSGNHRLMWSLSELSARYKRDFRHLIEVVERFGEEGLRERCARPNKRMRKVLDQLAKILDELP